MFVFNRNKIKGIMAEKNCTQRDLARVMDLSENQTHKKLANKVDFKVSELIQIANYFDVDPSIFFAPTVQESRTANTNR